MKLDFDLFTFGAWLGSRTRRIQVDTLVQLGLGHSSCRCLPKGISKVSRQARGCVCLAPSALVWQRRFLDIRSKDFCSMGALAFLAALVSSQGLLTYSQVGNSRSAWPLAWLLTLTYQRC